MMFSRILANTSWMRSLAGWPVSVCVASSKLVHGGRAGVLGGVLCHVADQGDELFVLGDEVGLRVDLDQDAQLAVLADERFHDALRAGAAFFDFALCIPLAEQADRHVHVAVGLGQKLLRFHHPGLCLVPQFLDHCGGNLCHSD